ncbi:MAG: Brix domain-containing protein [Thermoproteus sp. AZ2]|jgi:U3 small nucleolar ribonucleoprotein protein IMP4|uniref:Brix domain-containing protein n=1 Tax=Thermoproteus sp. AZ2 TaxID=1609232 RepID=A0ACC6V182_9CREN|nr:MAG: ribosomal biosynthesis protein [Thermoproteus sp. AZ2]
MEDDRPAALLTSSRSPSIRVREFINDLENALPGIVKLTRGKMSLEALLEEAIAAGAERILIVYDRRGNPSSIRAIDVVRRAWSPYALVISGVKMREDMPVAVLRRRKAESAAVVDYTASEIPDVLTSWLRYPLFYSVDLERLRGRYDTLIVVRGSPGAYSLEVIDGGDLGPRGPTIKIRGVKTSQPREAAV